jgi:hypothetical protein
MIAQPASWFAAFTRVTEEAGDHGFRIIPQRFHG